MLSLTCFIVVVLDMTNNTLSELEDMKFQWFHSLILLCKS